MIGQPLDGRGTDAADRGASALRGRRGGAEPLGREDGFGLGRAVVIDELDQTGGIGLIQGLHNRATLAPLANR
jgi:hypothetical protein